MTDRFHELEQLLDRRLTDVPAPRAPETLVPRVMRAVRTAPAPAATGWLSWPLVWQLASGAALAVLVLGVVQLWPVIDATLAAAWARPEAVVGSRLGAIADAVAPFLTAARVIWRVVVEPVGVFLILFIAAMGAASALFGSALRHVAIGGLSR
jgi:hypothetical protein